MSKPDVIIVDYGEANMVDAWHQGFSEMVSVFCSCGDFALDPQKYNFAYEIIAIYANHEELSQNNKKHRLMAEMRPDTKNPTLPS